ncbi:MAG: 50S ribosomal protein L21 [Pseudomonadota bacterium]
MYAVIKTGGKQYRVAADDVLKIEKVEGEVGETISFGSILMVGGDDPTVGSPLVDGAEVTAEVVAQGRARKIIVFKKKRRQNYRRKKGHRQHETTVRITGISLGGKTLAQASEKPVAPAESAEPEELPASDDLPTLFDAPEGGGDDLTKISGVGPKIAEKLNAMGITTFAQVAAFTEEDIAKVDDLLNFKGRIGREDWVSQAKTLAEGD